MHCRSYCTSRKRRIGYRAAPRGTPRPVLEVSFRGEHWTRPPLRPVDVLCWCLPGGSCGGPVQIGRELDRPSRLPFSPVFPDFWPLTLPPVRCSVAPPTGRRSAPPYRRRVPLTLWLSRFAVPVRRIAVRGLCRYRTAVGRVFIAPLFHPPPSLDRAGRALPVPEIVVVLAAAFFGDILRASCRWSGRKRPCRSISAPVGTLPAVTDCDRFLARGSSTSLPALLSARHHDE